jgi:hypothetical protein
VTPISAEAVTVLHDLIKQDADMLDETSRQRLQKHVQKLTNATQLSFSERALLHEQNRFLAEINSEAKVRRSTKAKIIGTARVMSYEDLENARAERAAKDAEKEAKKTTRAPAAEETNAGKRKRGRPRKVRAEDADADTHEDADADARADVTASETTMVRGSDAADGERDAGREEQTEERRKALGSYRIPVARMW